MKKLYAFILSAAAVFSVLPFGAAAADTAAYPTYTINSRYEEAQSPAAYNPVAVLYGEDMGLSALENPADLHVEAQTVYLVDQKLNSLFILDSSLKHLKTIDKFTYNGTETSFSDPQGVCVSPAGDIYVADTGNARVIRFDSMFNCKAIYDRPEISVMTDQEYEYKPVKVGVDKANRIYVAAQGINEGLIELSADGEFMSFLGAPKVTYNFFTYIWKQILPEEAAKNLEKTVPTEVSNLKVDNEGFIYTTIKANDIQKLQNAIRSNDQETVKAVQRFNASGVDILKRYGDVPVVGDVNFRVAGENENEESPAYNPSLFTDITIDSSDSYFCLDSRRCRVFCYDSDGSMLYAFGTKGNQLGTFTQPVAIDLLGERLLVLDSALKRITVFERTAYGKLLSQADGAYSDGNYKEALGLWDEVFKYNANLTISYVGKGKCYYYLGDYEQAYKNLKAAEEYYYCSKAFSKYRGQLLTEHFVPVVSALAASAVLIATLVIIRKRRKRRRMQ